MSVRGRPFRGLSTASSTAMSEREFRNSFPDFQPQVLKQIIANDKLHPNVRKQVKETVETLLKKLEDGVEDELAFGSSDESVYTGTTGIALLYLHLHKHFPDAKKPNRWLSKANEIMEQSLKKRTMNRRISFLCGDPGLSCVAALFYKLSGDQQRVPAFIQEVLSLAGSATEDASHPDEFLYGRCGYLYALNFLRRFLGAETLTGAVMDGIFTKVMESGSALSKTVRSTSPLMYMWHDSYYLGAAHGLSGILFTLLRSDCAAKNDANLSLIERTLEFLMRLRFPSGNYPSSLGSKSGDKLVHWCHGAPGFIHLFLQAYKVFGKEIYLAEAKSCAEVIWQRGLLRKGYGLCHGVAGNGYAFLMLWRSTRDPKYLYRAIKFAEWIADYGKHGCRHPDRPYSLFEGLAGTIYFLVDLLHPDEAEFPAFY